MKAQLDQLKLSLVGHQIAAPIDPRPLVVRPWYPAMIDFNQQTAGNAIYYKPSDLMDKLIDQLGLGIQNKVNLNIRLIAVYMWTIAAGPSSQRPTANLDIGTVLTPAGDPATPGPAEIFCGKRELMKDIGSLSRPARCGWKYSINDAQQPINYSTNYSILEAAGNLDNALVRFKIKWSFTGVADPIALGLPPPPPPSDEEEEAPPLVEVI